MSSYLFKDRATAGKALAEKLHSYAGRKNTLILALPRGGVPVAYEISKALSLPLDILLVRKLGAPGNEELAMGAIAMHNICFMNQDIVQGLRIPHDAIEQVILKEKAELIRRNRLYREDKPGPFVKDKTVILVDDGLATGATMQTAIVALREEQAKHIIVAVPVGAESTCNELSSEVDKVVCLSNPEPFYGVGQWYKNFFQLSDIEVQDLLRTALHQEVEAHNHDRKRL